MDKVIKTFVSEIRAVNEKEFTVEAVVSDETVDRYGEVISIEAWKKRLKRYKDHAVLLSSHRYDKLTNQIGEATKVFIDGKNLVANFKYYAGEGNEEADWGWKLASKFKKAAYSVGFIPYDAKDADWEKDAEAIKVGKKPRRTYTDIELIEISQVLVPANPSALQKSFEEEEDVVIKEYSEMVLKDLNAVDEKDKELEGEVITKPDTENYFHIAAPGQEGKHKGHDIKTITISAKEGIKAHYCVGCKRVTGYMFDTKKWSKSEAEKWVKDHNKDFELVEDRDIEESLEGKDLYWIIEEKKKKKPNGGCKTVEEEEMEKVLEAINEIKQLVTDKFDNVEKMFQKWEEDDKAISKALDDAEKEEADRIAKEKEDSEKKSKEDNENYLKSLLEDTTNILKKHISVPSE